MPSRHLTTSLFAFVLSATLSACGGGGASISVPSPAPPAMPVLPTGIDYDGNGAPTDPLAAFTTQASFQPTARQGLEIVNVTAISDGVLSITPEASPTLTLARTTTGFDMTSGQNLARFDTRPESRRNSGTNTFAGCFENSCTGSGLGLRLVETKFNSGAASTLSYSTYGAWRSIVSVIVVNGYGVFATGLPSTVSQVPTTGTASYTGGASGFVVIDIGDRSRNFNGTASLNADFAGRTINGSISNITTNIIIGNPQAGTLGNIALNSGTINGAAFTGTAAGMAATGSYVNLAGATGQFGGAFYGPNANEVAGSFTLTSPEFTIIGSFGAKR